MASKVELKDFYEKVMEIHKCVFDVQVTQNTMAGDINGIKDHLGRLNGRVGKLEDNQSNLEKDYTANKNKFQGGKIAVTALIGAISGILGTFVVLKGLGIF